ncbi:hypothetical protein AVI51_01565 [Piscirickettsia salmonis]|uniref:Type VI lipoprotein IgE-like C-terminal domain-containing protein n=1 Tax=Piscirickettsia salmonis TaxID=1238 RepID=A0A9Q5VK76_PISSA|nr:lipoprotein [Piscirickettsia salmonis]ALA24747.1 lipoprotein [Piscirickettsia salmonis]APS45077.1 hypothetical protein AVI48_12295 [Piscirickettsia salmonis]APS48437.1 hypothetical protein AVI49_12905 [Piscirickettsia salmonis]APS49696.1 hypothetical protein AVI50_01610 [Piscirickettsia salmonis]APS52877.1 hypothetical protein AVI51_01565 [Piscirickettsia salmonis]
MKKLLINLLARWNIVSLFALLALMSGCSMLGLGGDPELTIKVTTHQYTNNGNNFYLLVAQDNNKSYISHSYYSLYSQFNSSQYQRYFITPKYESSYSFSYPLDRKKATSLYFLLNSDSRQWKLRVKPGVKKVTVDVSSDKVTMG